MVADSVHSAAKKEEEDKEIELNLELSLGSNMLMRSSSVAPCLPVVQGDCDLLVSVPEPHSSLGRSSSLPVESEKELSKRKQQQSLRRLEAKRRRSEKQRLLREERNATGSSVQSINPQEAREKESIASLLSLGERNMVSSDVQSGQQMMRPDQLTTRGDSDSPTKKLMEDMPSVFTVGGDPNRRRVDGILYKYGRAEEVRIMCICHGNFYSPADFIKHAGGTNVDCPLKHIVVNRSSSFL